MRIRTAIVALGITAAATIAAATPPTLSVPQAAPSADGTDVTGTVAFAEAGEQCVMDAEDGFVTAFSDPDVADALGLDLVDACITPIDGGLRFTWVMGSALPPTVPPEGIRYNWAFGFEDGQTLQLQAKRTNLVSVTTAEDPVGHALHASDTAGWFQVRGACQTSYQGTPVAGCFHLAFVSGGFDVDNGRVWMDLPFDPHDAKNLAYAPLFTPGSRISEAQSASMSIAASGQAGVSNTSTSQYINGWGGYTIGEVVRVGVGDTGSSATWVGATVTDGAYRAHVPATGSRAFAEACQGFVCTKSAS